MIKLSPEICAVVRRHFEASRDGDAETMRGGFSKHPALRYIGSELEEIYEGEMFRKGVVGHFAEGPRYQYAEELLEAYESGKVGWAFWRGQIIFHVDGQEVRAQYRNTIVFVLEEGSWKIIQVHISNPDSTFQSLGVPNETMKALEAAARNEELGLGTSGMASVMFTDIVDSSAVADRMGDRLWTERIDAHLAEVRGIVETCGGTLVKSLGDGTMSTFTSSRNALAAARDIQNRAQADQTEPRLRLRIGLHTGEVIENKGDFFGTVVNKAARIADFAHSGEIQVSEATRLMAGAMTDFQFSEPAEARLKGFDKPQKVYVLS